MMMNKGLIDEPVKNDKFAIQNYVDGISKFILTCDTPMTMSIQGGWGSGKTSIMELVKNQIEDKVSDVIWFNTWQVSQFNLDDKLTYILLNRVINKVSGNQYELKEKGVTIVKSLFEIGAARLTGGVSAKVLTPDAMDDDIVEKIAKLKETYAKVVKNKTGDDGRIVFFIDDLDRLESKKVVELLEVLKIFLDCKNCVYVLALDYDVVDNGVKDKYGANYTPEIGRSFFDKVVQVTFKMPVDNYNIKQYVEKYLKELDVNTEDEKLLDKYAELIKHSVGNNPRTMKKIINNFYLLLCILDKEIVKTEDDKLIVFALLCMQRKYDNIFNQILENAKNMASNSISELSNQGLSFIEALDVSEEEKEQIKCFVKDVYLAINNDENTKISEEKLSTLKNILKFF